MQNVIKLESFSAVGAGETANLVLSPGVTYDGIYLETNVPPAQINSVRLELNAEQIFDLSGTELKMLDDYEEKGIAFAGPTYRYALPIQMEEAISAQSERFTSLVIGPGDNCVINVEIDGTATAPTLKAFAETSPFREVREVVRKFERYTVPVAAAGIAEFYSIQRGDRVLRMHFKTGDMNGLEVVRNRLKVFEIDSGRNDYLLTREHRTPQTGYFHFDPIKGGYPRLDSFVTAADQLTFKLDMAASGNVEILVERISAKQARDWRSTKPAGQAKGRRGIGRR
ncbi:major capsid protein P2 [Saccharospirillum salsuginis]|uniref:Viral coat protein P2 N-terminal domain-containing protein n=1 Tax=Saccharospirillum salsuginis TaxID=418750 RepID=A0A918K8E4_9GAMM|nr:major capsid protein P2 [Saccharospirillum salsuginis]GGX52299.1 hypothetical protein GCM10007392_19540 [Saccharospirillum salsuginis]